MRVLMALMLVLGVLYPRSSMAGCGTQARDIVDRSTFAISSKVTWRDLARGRMEARQANLPILAHFSFGSQCRHCRELEQQLFSNTEVLTILNSGKRVVPVEIPLWALTAAERAFAEQLDYGDNCLLALVDVDGQILTTASGDRKLETQGLPDPEAFAKALQSLAN